MDASCENPSETPDAGSDVGVSSVRNSQTSGFTPPLFSSPNSSIDSRVSGNTPVINPLVRAGLVPGNLTDILTASEPDIQPKRKARMLIEDE